MKNRRRPTAPGSTWLAFDAKGEVAGQHTDETGTTVSIVHVFADADAMDSHMEGAVTRARRAYDYLEPIGFEVYGEPTDGYLAAMRELPNADALLRVEPNHRAGFSRFSG